MSTAEPKHADGLKLAIHELTVLLTQRTPSRERPYLMCEQEAVYEALQEAKSGLDALLKMAGTPGGQDGQ
jgi:hypothetical protein